MAYLEKVRKGKITYYYLSQTVRMKDKFKKVRWFLEKGKLSHQKLHQLANAAVPSLKEKVAQFKKVKEPLVFDKDTLVKLTSIKVQYQRLLRSVSKIEYDVIEKQQLIRFTFNTNAIEGSTITLKDTAHILDQGIVPEGKSLREIYEVENTKKAYYFMKKYSGKVSISFIKLIHHHLTFNILGENSGEFRRIQVYMGGSKHMLPRASDLSKEMNSWMRWINNHQKLHPVLLSAYVHHLFIAIHPFIDGNGRTGRLLLNFMLMKSGFPPVCIKSEERIHYTNLLEQARDGDAIPFVRFIAAKVEESYNLLVDTIK